MGSFPETPIDPKELISTITKNPLIYDMIGKNVLKN